MKFYLDFEEPKRARKWKRGVILAVALVFFAVSGLFIVGLPGDTLARICIKWSIVLLFSSQGIRLLVVFFRGEARQTDKTLDDLMDGI